MIRIGITDYPYDRIRYRKTFPVVELRLGLLSPPKPKSLRKWQKEAPEGFEHIWVASQSFTFRPKEIRAGRKLELLEGESPADQGHLLHTELNQRLWQVVLDQAEALGTSKVLIETPAGFVPSPVNKQRLRNFAQGWGAREGLQILWSPAGFWAREEQLELCAELGIIPVIDPLLDLDDPLPNPTRPAYFRLLGARGLRTSYDDVRLETLAEICAEYEEVTVIFRTEKALRDASRFGTLCEEMGLDLPLSFGGAPVDEDEDDEE